MKKRLSLVMFIIYLTSFAMSLGRPQSANNATAAAKNQITCNKPGCTKKISRGVNKWSARSLCQNARTCWGIYCSVHCQKTDQKGHQFYCNVLNDNPSFGNRTRMPTKLEVTALLKIQPHLKKHQ